MADNHGKFCWYELQTTDTTAAKAFYTSLIGWSTQTVPMPGMEYAMWIKPGSKDPMKDAIGGVSVLAEEAKAMGAPPNWLVNIAVNEVDANATKAAGLGAKVYVPPTDIPGFGRFAVLADPYGAVFAIYTGSQPDFVVADMDMSLGGVSWNELYTDDIEGALAFYGKMFGWKKTTSMDMGPEMGIYQMYGLGEKSFGGIMKRPPNVPMSAWLPYFTVADVEATLKKTTELGGKLMHGPSDVPGGGKVAVAFDPQGAAFAVFAGPKP